MLLNDVCRGKIKNGKKLYTIPNRTVPMPSFTPIIIKIVFVASVLIKKFTHIGIIKNMTKILPDFSLDKMYATGYPITRQIIEVINPTRRELPRMINEDDEVKNSLKFSNVNLLLSSKNAETRIKQRGVIIKISINRTYGYERTLLVAFAFFIYFLNYYLIFRYPNSDSIAF